MNLVRSEKIYTTQSYCKEFLGVNLMTFSKRDELRNILDNMGYNNVWDRPLSEIDEVIECGEPVVLVDCSYIEDGEVINEYRWFETIE